MQIILTGLVLPQKSGPGLLQVSGISPCKSSDLLAMGCTNVVMWRHQNTGKLYATGERV